MRPPARPLSVRLMKGGDADAEMIWMAPHLVKRDEAVVAVKGRVLQALGHDRPAILLHLHGEPHHSVPTEPAPRLCNKVRRQQIMQEIEDTLVGRVVGAAGLGDRPIDIAAVLRRRLRSVDIGPGRRESGR
jgi:hypothetical protein